MASGSEFDGYEFSNNLVSDLAPLVALFGEQVTTQFLGLSMGWADNVLLAMGPLGIITILMSAIRIGGGRKLKSLVGRAREPQAVAEQELLSSTSADVCELWNGQQVIRIIGEPIGMKTVVTTSDGGIYDLRKALDKGIITIATSNDQNDYNAENLSPAEEFRVRYERLQTFSNRATLDLPANLSLNARSKPVSPLELKIWATVGVILQTSATAFPAVATYYFRWNKGDIPVAGYGYPCYLAGTIALTIGLILCGHIIEGATLETDFKLSQSARSEGLRIWCLQEALTVGDQRFPSCAISFGEQDGVLRTSRRGYLKHGRSWSRASATTCITIIGYIAQFVGLRALHWSATLVQLAATFIMTGIRAFARRSLASEPNTSDSIFKSHFMPWLTLLLRFEAERKSVANGASNGLRRKLQDFLPQMHYGKERRQRVHFEENQFFCELISDHSQESSVIINWLRDSHSSRRAGPYIRDESGYVSDQLLRPVEGPLTVSLRFLTGVSTKDAHLEDGGASNSLRTHAKIAPHINETNTRTEDNDYENASAVLHEVIEKVMNYLSTTDNLSWKSQIKALLNSEKNLAQPLQINWGFDMREGRISEYHIRAKSQKHIRVTLRHDHPDSRWKLDQSSRDHLQAAISLSLYTNAARLTYATGKAHISTPATSRKNTQQFQRIVGYAENFELADRRAQMQEWLGSEVEASTFSDMRDRKRARENKEALGLIEENGRSPQLRQQLESLFQRTNEVLIAIRQLRKDTEQLSKLLRQGVGKSYLGMFLSSYNNHTGNDPDDKFNELVVKKPSQATTAMQYAQELFSLFILALSSEVESIDEKKQKKSIDGDHKVSREHPVFSDIADILVEKKLAGSMDEAYVLIIPAFAKHKLLPTDPGRSVPTGRQDPAEFPIPL